MIAATKNTTIEIRFMPCINLILILSGFDVSFFLRKRYWAICENNDFILLIKIKKTPMLKNLWDMYQLIT
ncbi:MAG: hypothetical protein RJA07_1859 [Bacteroidota bacterium]|jgi:hypothetical protein